MLKPVKIISIEENQNPKFIKTELVTAERDGIQFKWERIKSHDSVHVIVYNLTTREFLFVKQVRIPVLCNDEISGGKIIECTAGLVDKEHTPQQIAKEEILEELGYNVPTESVHFIKTIKSSVGTSGTNAHLFYAEVTEVEKVSEGGGLDTEDIKVVRVSIDEVEDFIFEATTDAVTLFLTMYYINLIKDD
jgi:UDP-sugar diphosphatase